MRFPGREGPPCWGAGVGAPAAARPVGHDGPMGPGARWRLPLWAGFVQVLCSLPSWWLGSRCQPRSLGLCPGARLAVWGRDQNSKMSQVIFVITPQNKAYGSFKVQVRLVGQAPWTLLPARSSGLGWGPVPK